MSLYTPNRNPEPNAFFASLNDLIDLTRPVFVAQDLNCVLDNLLDRKRRPSFAGGESGLALQSSFFYSNLSFVAYDASWSHASGTFVAHRHDLGADEF